MRCTVIFVVVSGELTVLFTKRGRSRWKSAAKEPLYALRESPIRARTRFTISLMMSSMLPEDLLIFLDDQIPCRKLQIRQIASLLGVR